MKAAHTLLFSAIVVLAGCNSDNSLLGTTDSNSSTAPSQSNGAPEAAVGSGSNSNSTDNNTGSANSGGGTVDTSAPGTAEPPVAFSINRFSVANGCFVMQNIGNGKFVTAKTDGSYAADAAVSSNAAPLFLKPTALGKYMVYNAGRKVMQAPSGASGSPVSSTETLADNVEWALLEDEKGRSGFSLTNPLTNRKLALLGTSNRLGAVESSSVGEDTLFNLVKASGCADFPEISTNTTGDTFTGKNAKEPAFGFADVHNHITATTFLGGTHHGRPHHKFGVTHALSDCKETHGPDGRQDYVGNIYGGTPQATHATQGWPTFASWPAARSLTHEGLYYKWLERAWKSGLRIFVTNLVENEVLCNLVVKAKGNPTQNCNEMESAVSQIEYAKNLQDYVDAQNGGPGKGWLRIVTSPAEARSVIAQGKLAMVLGIEISHLFNCSTRNGQDGCNKAEIDRQLDRLYALGVRQMFPIHEFDNAMGGNGIFDGFVLNGGNFLDTGSFWQTYDCPGKEENYKNYLYTPGADMTTALPGYADDPLSKEVHARNPGLLPVYPAGKRQCNRRGLTEIGKYAFSRMMERGVIIEVDHLELSIKSDLINMASRQMPAYPLVSTHGGHGGISNEQARQILDAGGIIYPYHHDAKTWSDELKKISALKSSKYEFAMGFGADTNGLGSQAGPRPAGSTPLKYPFTLFENTAAWKGVVKEGTKPLTFEQQKSGERFFDANKEGQAHYGLKADFVKEVEIEGGNEALKALYKSAEVYIQMWERTTAKRQKINP